MAVSHVFSNAVPDATGTMTVWFGATTATVAASDVVKPGDWNSAHNQVVTLSGNTVGVGVVTGTNIVFAGTNNVTLSGVQGANAGTIHISAAAGGGGGSVNVSAGTTSNNLTNFVFADSNGVSFGLAGSTVTATVRTNYQSAGAYLTTARASNDAVGLNTAQSNVTWTINSSGLSLDARGYAGSGFTSTTTAGTAVVATQNSNGLSMAVPQFLTTAQPVGAYLTTARASNDAIGLNTAQSNVTWTVNSSGLSLDARGYAGTGTTIGATNLSASATLNSNGLQLSLSGPAAGGGGLTQGTFYAQSNTTQSSSGTIALSSLNFAGAGIASVGITNGSVLISVPAGGGAGDGFNILAAGTQTAGTASTVLFQDGGGVTFGMANSSVITATVKTDYLTSQSNQAFSAAGGSSAFQTLGFSDNAYASWTNTNGSVALTELRASLFAVSNTTQSSSGTQNLDAISFAGAGIASVGVSNGSVVISVPAGGGAGDGGVFAGVSNLGNTAGSTGTVSTGNFVLVGSNGISLSQSTGAAGSAATISIFGPQLTLSDAFLLPDAPFRGIGTVNPNQNSLYIQPFSLMHPLSASTLIFPAAVTNSSSGASSGQVGATYNIAIYSQHSTDSKRLTLHSSTSATMAASYSSNVSWMISGYSSLVNSTSYATFTSSSAGILLSSILHGDRAFMFAVNSLSAGQWWIGMVRSTSGAGTVGNILNISHVAHSSVYAAPMGIATSATSGSNNMKSMGLGVWSGNATTIPASLSFNEIGAANATAYPFQAHGVARV